MDRDDKIANIGAFLDIAARALDAADALCDAEYCKTDHDLALDINIVMDDVQDLQKWFWSKNSECRDCIYFKVENRHPFCDHEDRTGFIINGETKACNCFVKVI